MFELLIPAFVVWFVSRDSNSASSESTTETKSTDGAGDSVPNSGDHDTSRMSVKKAMVALEAQQAAAQQQATQQFMKELEEFNTLCAQGKPIPDHLLRGGFRHKLSIMAEKLRREEEEERQAQRAQSSQQN